MRNALGEAAAWVENLSGRRRLTELPRLEQQPLGALPGANNPGPCCCWFIWWPASKILVCQSVWSLREKVSSEQKDAHDRTKTEHRIPARGACCNQQSALQDVCPHCLRKKHRCTNPSPRPCRRCLCIFPSSGGRFQKSSLPRCSGACFPVGANARTAGCPTDFFCVDRWLSWKCVLVAFSRLLGRCSEAAFYTLGTQLEEVVAAAGGVGAAAKLVAHTASIR